MPDENLVLPVYKIRKLTAGPSLGSDWNAPAWSGAEALTLSYVRCLHSGFQEEVWQDACVEFFIGIEGRGYMNFEMNCGGRVLCYHVHKNQPGGGLHAYTNLTPVDRERMYIWHSLPEYIDPEISEVTPWRLQFTIDQELIEKALGVWGGPGWRGNFYKCAENNSHPHWVSWAPIPWLNFHSPDFFGHLRFM